MTDEEYWMLRILLEKWAHHTPKRLPNPFDGVGVEVASRAGWHVYSNGSQIHVYDGPMQYYEMNRLFSCDKAHIDGIIASLRMSQSKGG